MSELNPTPPEETTAIDDTNTETPSPITFSAKAKRIIALLFISNILFGVSAFFIWRSSNTRIAALNAVMASMSEPEEEDPYAQKDAPVRAADVVGNFTDEMKIPYTAYLNELALREERAMDHPGSPYFYNYDFYNAESTDTLTILPHFRTIQQAKNFTCGLLSIQMVLDYYGRMGDWNEETLRQLVPEEKDENGEDLHVGYCLEQLISIFNQIGGFDLRTTYDYQDDNYWDIMPSLFLEFLKEGTPVIVGSIQRGGHWMVLIGYDDMGTPLETYDDVFILADSSDGYDHNRDGYSVISAQDYFSTFHFYTLQDLEDHQADYCFIAARPIEG